MKLSQNDQLHALEGRLREAIAASKKIRDGKYPLRDRGEKVYALQRKVEDANKLVKGL